MGLKQKVYKKKEKKGGGEVGENNGQLRIHRSRLDQQLSPIFTMLCFNLKRVHTIHAYHYTLDITPHYTCYRISHVLLTHLPLPQYVSVSSQKVRIGHK